VGTFNEFPPVLPGQRTLWESSVFGLRPLPGLILTFDITTPFLPLAGTWPLQPVFLDRTCFSPSIVVAPKPQNPFRASIFRCGPSRSVIVFSSTRHDSCLRSRILSFLQSSEKCAPPHRLIEVLCFQFNFSPETPHFSFILCFP